MGEEAGAAAGGGTEGGGGRRKTKSVISDETREAERWSRWDGSRRQGCGKIMKVKGEDQQGWFGKAWWC